MEQIFGLILATAFGAIFGSYATLFSYRLPLGESCFGRYFGPKSRCPKCENIIKTRDLIPLLNWLFTLGRCRFCKTKIPRTHLFVELATTLSFVLCYIKFGFSEDFIVHATICVGLVILLTCDYTHKIFPEPVLNLILMIGLANRVLVDGNFSDAIFSAAIGIFCAVIFYQIFYKKFPTLKLAQTQIFDYTKFVLITAVCLSLSQFLFYFLTVMTIFIILLLLNSKIGRKPANYGFALVIPFFWMMLFSSIFS
jgi:prepilin signal peptidase PulO-like enzyme (type II secretory pathway)